MPGFMASLMKAIDDWWFPEAGTDFATVMAQSMKKNDLPAPFQVGDFIRLKGPTNPHKGNIRFGKSYQVQNMAWYTLDGKGGYGWVRFEDERGVIAQFDIRDFEPDYFGDRTVPLKADDYEEAIAAQDAMEKAQ